MLEEKDVTSMSSVELEKLLRELAQRPEDTERLKQALGWVKQDIERLKQECERKEQEHDKLLRELRQLPHHVQVEFLQELYKSEIYEP